MLKARDQWQLLIARKAGVDMFKEELERIEVPGGWIYRSTQYYAEGGHSESSVFVPSSERRGES